MNKIIIVEDELGLANGLKYNLEIENFTVDIFSNAEEALPVFSHYNMMILDIMLPEMSGIELLKKIRKLDHRYPILILSAKTSEKDLVEGLSAGADDYITKPFSLVELILRIKRIVKRQTWYFKEAKGKRIYCFGEFWINFNTFEALSNKGKVKLTQYECYVMRYLIENKDRLVSRDELLEKIWGYEKEMGIETRTVDIFIARLRKLFESDRSEPKYIKSFRGIGYRFFDN